MLGACLLFAAVGCLAMISPDEKNIALGDDGVSSGAGGAEAQEVRVRDYAYQAVGAPEEDSDLEAAARRSITGDRV